ncbi:PqqD family protein [Nocardioides sp. ChNu-153]|uniref:PqqD family protein n=1 Tax=unclassified Nocardioides TaxID=2615069 RepID=UPI002407736D|nr:MULTISPECIES: PqqD family protein [unclassified Nocardioides]MDF9716380.1 PqqD family protein [Nocardioides sp. ChNu-99]MDN7122886.1 PqqD family protein [Nocardioides sp. ChNu-153]
MDLDDGTVLARNPTTVSARIEETVVLLDEQREHVELEGVGVTVWEALAAPTTVGALVGLLAQEYDAEPATVRRDVVPFLGELVRRGVVRAG